MPIINPSTVLIHSSEEFFLFSWLLDSLNSFHFFIHFFLFPRETLREIFSLTLFRPRQRKDVPLTKRFLNRKSFFYLAQWIVNQVFTMTFESIILLNLSGSLLRPIFLLYIFFSFLFPIDHEEAILLSVITRLIDAHSCHQFM